MNETRPISVPPGLKLTRRDGVAEIRFDRPERKNAISAAMWRAIPEIVAALEDDRAVRVVVMTGASHDFSAGADISEFDTLRKDAETARIYEASNATAFRAIRECRKPVVAAIRGICFGGGFGLAAAADIRLATPEARFCVPAARLGLAYPQDAVVDIVAALGSQMARHLIFSAEVIGADRALACGFLAEIVDASAFDERVSGFAATIAANAPLSVAASKAAIRAVVSGDPGDASMARRLGDATFDSADYAEGRAAFQERRKPLFRGR